MNEKTRVAVLGCGAISEIYLKNLICLFREVDVIGVCDLDLCAAEKRQAEFSLPKCYRTYSDLLADDDVEVVLNLTNPLAHFETTVAAIAAGKNVYLEKPLATTFKEALELDRMANEAGVRLGCSPDTPLGAGIQTCRKLLDDGYIGRILGFSANLFKRGVEARRPNPDFLFKKGGGPLLDMGPYYLTALVQMAGPVTEVSGMWGISFPERTVTSQPGFGRIIKVDVPTYVNSLLRLESGALGVFTATFDVYCANLPHLEIFGTDGTLSIPYPNDFNGPIRLFRREKGEFLEIPPLFGYGENSRGLGLADMCKALRTGRPHRAGADIAVHVLEVIEAIQHGAVQKNHVAITTRYERPAPMTPCGVPGILD